jgi:exopolysaccharide biosynthesis predicted pyruvyltransferase EpsI
MNEHATIQGVTAMTSNNQVLQALKELGPFYYQPNPGNMGDHLIAHATREFFRKNSLPFSPFFMETLQRSEPFPLVYGGGGPFVPYYGMVPEIMRLLANPAVSRVVILPSSFYQCDEVAELLDERVTVFCREERSFRYLSRLNRRARVLLAHDMAFTLDARQAVRNLPEEILNDPEFREKAALAGEGLHLLEDGRKALLFLRTDAEAGPGMLQIV